MHIEITKQLEQVEYSAALIVTGAWRGKVDKGIMKNWTGKSCIIEGGTKD